MAELIVAASATMLATGLGAVPVFAFGTRSTGWLSALHGYAAGVMGVAAIVGLLMPGLDEGEPVEVWAGFGIGVVFLVLVRRRLEHVRRSESAAERASLLVFAVLFVHSMPEGLAIGTAYASSTQGLGLFVVVAIAIQNVPEGTSIAIPMSEAGRSASSQFWVAVGSSVPQPIGAVLAYLLVEQVSALLPLSFGFAAGAMLAVVVLQMLPDALAARRGPAAIGAVAGAVTMLAFSIAFGI